jgi:hypothetical protein
VQVIGIKGSNFVFLAAGDGVHAEPGHAVDEAAELFAKKYAHRIYFSAKHMRNLSPPTFPPLKTMPIRRFFHFFSFRNAAATGTAAVLFVLVLVPKQLECRAWIFRLDKRSTDNKCPPRITKISCVSSRSPRICSGVATR